MSKLKSLWQALESVPGLAAIDAEWRTYMGADYEFGKAFLRPNGKLASSYPCTIPRGCGCNHEVIVHNLEDIVAVCRCEHGCETFPLKRADIVVYGLDRSTFDTAVANAFGLFKETDARTDLHGTTRIGVYSPYSGFRFPVYLTIQLEPDDFADIVDGLLGRNDTPFILLAPTHDLCTAKGEKRLTDKRSSFVPLSENMAIGDKRKLRLLHPLDEILTQFRATNLPSPKDNSFRVFFPTPSDAIWGDVSICFNDGYTVSIKVKSASGVFNYTQMGMANNHNSNPTKRWKLLETLAKNKGILDWSSPEAEKHLKKQKEQLSKSLRDFFRLEGDPIEWVKSEHNYRCRFRVCMEGSELSESALYFPGAIDYPPETRPRSKKLSGDDEAED